MSDIEKILATMRRNPKGIRFRDLCKVCDATLANPGRAAAVIVFTKHPGREILV